MSDIAIVQASFGDPGEAALVARKLLEERLAACTSLVPVTSISSPAAKVSTAISWPTVYSLAPAVRISTT